mgnify:CR=1 FL=1
MVSSPIHTIPCLILSINSLIHPIHACLLLYRFLPDNNDHVIDVRLKDTVQFLCPYYERVDAMHQPLEHYIIYRVRQPPLLCCRASCVEGYDIGEIRDKCKTIRIVAFFCGL